MALSCVSRISFAAAFIALLMAGTLHAAEPTRVLIIQRRPATPAEKPAARAVPATQPSATLPNITARIAFTPGVPIITELAINNQTFSVQADIEEKSPASYAIKITLSLTEQSRQESGSGSSSSASSIEKFSTSLRMPPEQEKVAGSSALSQWTIKIEKRDMQK